MNAFISWAGADREVKNVIAAKLREAGIDPYDSDEFCVTNFSMECIRNIRRSAVFIVIVSEASMDPRSYVINEVVEARRLEGEGQLNILVYKVTDLPYTEPFAFNLNHISDANHLARVQRTAGTSGIDTLVKRAVHLIQRRQEGEPEKPYDVNVPKLVGTAVTQTKFFVDGSRDETLTAIEQAFERSHVIVLSELFGFGKKSVIRKYISQHPGLLATEIQGRHDALFDFFLNDVHFSNVNEDAFDKEDARSIVEKKFDLLKKLSPNCLIVASDVDMGDALDESLCALLGELPCRVVFITQSAAAAYADTFPVIPVGKMRNEHLFELFFHYYRCDSEDERASLMPHLERFFDDIGGHTKTVELAASVLYKELRATPEEVISHLSVGSRGNRELKDIILDTLSGLLSLQHFTEDERKTLLLISLMASPVIDERLLRELMALCEVERLSAITSLDEHHWITYDGRARTVYIEPLIAQICVKEFGDDEADVCWACLQYFQDLKWVTEDLGVYGTRVFEYAARSQTFFQRLGFDEIAELLSVYRAQAVSADVGVIRPALDRFSVYYTALQLANESTGSPDEVDLETAAAEWAHSLFYMALTTIEKMPMLFSLANTDVSSIKEIYEAVIGEELEELIEMDIGGRAFSSILQDPEVLQDKDSVEYYIFLLTMTMRQALIKKDLHALQSRAEELWDFLQDRPHSLETPEICALITDLIKILHAIYLSSNVPHMAIALYERILPIEWPSHVRYRLYLSYFTLLCKEKDEEEIALSVLEEAEELFEETMTATGASGTEQHSAALELALHRVHILTRMGELDEALERFDALKAQDAFAVLPIPYSELIELIADRLIAQDSERAAAFITANEHAILQRIEQTSCGEDDKESLRSLLLVRDLYLQETEGGFSAGGIVTDESYYQRYAKGKKTSPHLLMGYERIAGRARRYDLSGETNEQLAARSRALYARAAQGESRAKLLPEAFALVSEAGYRVLGYRHHQVQYVGAAAMLEGKIAEILNGEGKTYTIVLVAYVMSLYHPKAFVLDDSKSLTQRNYQWMRGVYELLGVGVGHLRSWQQDSTLLEDASLQVVYSDLSSFAFSVMRTETDPRRAAIDVSAFGAVIDEADRILIESANHAITFVDNVRSDTDLVSDLERAYALADRLRDEQDLFTQKQGQITLHREVCPLIEQAFGLEYEDLSQANRIQATESLVRLALYSFSLVEGKDFFVKGGTVCKEDVASGELREVNDKLGWLLAREHGHTAEEQYFRANLAKKTVITDSTHVYSLLHGLGEICGTSATVCSFKKEFKDIYDLDVVAVPPAFPVIRRDLSVGLYVRREDKAEDILEMMLEKHAAHQPILLVAESIEESLAYSRALALRGVEHTVFNGLNAESAPDILARAGICDSIVIATQLVNRGVDIKLGGDAERMTLAALVEEGVDVTDIDKIMYRLPSEEVRSSELYRRYVATFERERAIVAANKKQAIAAGGLCVISTTPHRDRRIEQQIRGRAGRQGDVGESYVFNSMEDKIMAPACARLTGRSIYDRVRTVDVPALHKVIEHYLDKVHHATFEDMRDAAVAAEQTDRSKSEILRLKDGLLDGTVTFDELLRLFSQGEDNVRSVHEIVNGRPEHATEAVMMLYRAHGELLTQPDLRYAQRTLLELARLAVDESTLGEDTKRRYLIDELLSVLSRYLTEMADTQELYSTSTVKNSGRILESLHAQCLSKHLIAGIGRWLIRLEPPRRPRLHPPRRPLPKFEPSDS